MTPEAIEQTVKSISQSERPFMVLFILILLVCIFLAFKILIHFQRVNDEHTNQIKVITEGHKHERDITYKMFAKEQLRSHVREEKLFHNLEQNTKQLQQNTIQLEDIAGTLKEMKFDFSNLESRVGDLSDEFVVLKAQVTKNQVDHE